MDWLAKYFDKYNRLARIYPAILTFAPVLWTAVAIFPGIVDGLTRSVVFAVVAVCLLHLSAAVTRARGKLVETALAAKWGGWPTTIILRHRDRTIDRLTKSRYHQALSTLCGIQFPTEAEEAKSPGEADEIYRSATKLLIENRRGAEFGILHDENASYGFWRNLYGLRPVLAAVALLSALVTSFAFELGLPTTVTTRIIGVAIGAHPTLPILSALDVLYVVLCLSFVRGRFVFQSGRDYAEALFRTLDKKSSP